MRDDLIRNKTRKIPRIARDKKDEKTKENKKKASHVIEKKNRKDAAPYPRSNSL